jgi:hypothetical protein
MLAKEAKFQAFSGYFRPYLCQGRRHSLGDDLAGGAYLEGMPALGLLLALVLMSVVPQMC